MRCRPAVVVILLAALHVLLAAPLSAQPANDTCAGAVVVAGASVTHTVDTRTATIDPDDGSAIECGCARNYHSVWYRFTAEQDSQVRVTSGRSALRTVITTFSGDACDSKEPAGCFLTTETVGFGVCAGRTVFFKVADRCNLGGGDVVFDVEVSPVPDADADGVSACSDSCPADPNPGQEDTDGDGAGDACDACAGPGSFDPDADGLCDATDNCPYAPNADQADTDSDGIGDPCDPCAGAGDVDSDEDGVCDLADVCPDDLDPGQADTDGDGAGDACDACAGPGALDPDDDELCENVDDCPFAFDPDQEDTDGDGAGDACDCDVPDADGDGYGAGCDSCPLVPNPDQLDTDADRLGDACDPCPTARECQEPGTTTSTSTTSTTSVPPTTTTLPMGCTGERVSCLCAAGLASPECGGQRVPGAARQDFTAACDQTSRAATAPRGRARRLLRRATVRLDTGKKTIRRASHRRLTAACAASLQTLLEDTRVEVVRLRESR